MKFRKCFALLVLALFVFSCTSPLAMADDRDFAQLGLGEMPTMTQAESGDLLLVYDASAKRGKTMDATNPSVTGDLTFRTDLLATGRKGGASTVSSSSTALDPASQSYTVVRKCIGGAGGLDETDGGTRLKDGKPGQMIVLLAITVEGSGTWIVTPETSLTFNTLTFDAVGEQTTLLYVNDTVGWVVQSTVGTTVDPIVTSFD